MRIVHSLDELRKLPGEPGVNGFRAREALRLDSTIPSWRAATEFMVVLTVSFGLGALAKMATLAITRWQFGRRCREQHEKLSRLVHGTAAR